MVLLSLLVISDLSISFAPQSQSHSFTVTFEYPNHPPRVVEQEVTSILENELSQLEELKRIYSRSSYGRGEIELSFPPNSDLAFHEIELNMLLRQLRPKLPQELHTPRVSRRSSEDKDNSPLMVYEFTYTGSDIEANTWLNDFLVPRMSAISSLEKVETIGNIEYAWKIRFDPDRLTKSGLSRRRVIAALSSAFRRTELGLIDDAEYSKPIFIHTNLQRHEDLERLRLIDAISLSDVAQVELATDRIRRYQRINGRKAIFINCYSHEGSNRIKAAQEVKEFAEVLSQDMPPKYQIQLNYDDTEYLRRELSKTWTRAILSMLVVTLFIFLTSFNWRYLLILTSSILVSLALTVLVSWALNLSFHLYTLAGLTIAIGILVDNTIVLVDHLRKKGNLSVIPAQLASAFTTIVALMVIWILPADFRQDLDDFGLIICIALLGSLLVSSFFSPAMGSLVGFSRGQDQVLAFRKKRLFQQRITRLQHGLRLGTRHRKVILTLFILGFGFPIFLLPLKWEGQDWYNQTFGSEFYQENLKVEINRWLGGSLRLFYREVYEKSSNRTPEKTRLYISASLPYGHTIQQMNEVMKAAETYLLGFREIDKFITRVHSGRYGAITVEFTEEAERKGFPYLLKNSVIQRALDWGGITWNVFGVGKGFSNANYESLPGFQVTLKGYQYEKLEGIAEDLAQRLLKHRRIQEVNTNGQLDWNEESLLLYRFQPNSKRLISNGFETTLNFLADHSFQHQPSLYLSYQDKDFPVYVESREAENISIFTSLHTGNDQIPLNYFGKLEKHQTLSAIHKKDRQYLRNVRFDYYGSFRFGSKYLEEVIDSMRGDLPAGFSIEREEWSWHREKERRQYELILLLMAGIFFISTIFLESLKKGFLVTLIIPFSFIGLFLMFGWGGFAFDQGGYAAFLMIGGLSVNALLYILNDYNHLMKKYEASKAMSLAISQKAWPILLTVVSTCSGLIPFLIHGEGEVFWFSFAIGTIGGLVFSLFVVFGLMPILLLPGRIRTSTYSSNS